MISRFEAHLFANEPSPHGQLHLSQSANNMQRRYLAKSHGRARFEPGSMRRDEYDQLHGGGDIVNKDSRGAQGARVDGSVLNGNKVGLHAMTSAPLLQNFLRHAQSKLALSGDKYAQRVIVKDDKAQLIFRNLDQFTTDETNRMDTEPTVRYNQLPPSTGSAI
jgi:hypothetical protein